MRTKSLLTLVLPLIALFLPFGPAGAAPAFAPLPPREVGVRWEGLAEARASKLVVYNLSGQPAQASLDSESAAGRGEALSLAAHGRAEIPASRLGNGDLRLRSGADLLVLQVPTDFDGSATLIETALPAPSSRPGERFQSVTPGATGTAQVTTGNGAARLEVAVNFLAPHSSVLIRQFDAHGNEVTSLVASASSPMRWRTLLGPVNGETRVELQTLEGEAEGTAAAVAAGRVRGPRSRILPPPQLKSGGGLAQYSPEINWSGNLSFNVTGAPASVCGDLHISRNFGTYTTTANWICTDASGNATAGPWSYASQSGDEEAYAYIQWPGSLSTNTAHHIWDKTAPTTSITSAGGPPSPTSFHGSATDPNYGSGFNSGSASCYTYFYDSTTDDYWSSGGSYLNAHFPVAVGCTLSGMPSRSVTWSSSSVPPGSAHISHHCYQWGVYVSDGGHQSANTYISFCIP